MEQESLPGHRCCLSATEASKAGAANSLIWHCVPEHALSTLCSCWSSDLIVCTQMHVWEMTQLLVDAWRCGECGS